MTGLVLTDANVLPERDVVLEEYNMRVANSPEARLGEQITAALYLNHPYGTAGDRLAPGDREAQPRGRARFLPPLLHAQQRGGGDRRRRDRRRGQARWRRRPTARSPAAPRSGRACGRRSRRRWRCARSRWPTRGSPSRACSAAISCPPTRPQSPAKPKRLKCSPSVLGNGETSRLYRALVVEQHLATNAGGYYQGTALDETRFGVYATPQPGVSLPRSKPRSTP